VPIDIANKVLDIEAEAILALKKRINGDFTAMVDALYNCKGRVIVAGLGKSGLIGSKFAASLSSTGTPSFFLHASEAVHGGLGIVSEGDVLVALSYSGESPELATIITHVKRLNIKVLSVTGCLNSSLARASDVVFSVKVKNEASTSIPFLPTASTTAMLALCDAVVVALLEKKGFYENDFAKIHPAGAIGKRFKAVVDLMRSGDDIPFVSKDARLVDVMEEITDKNSGITCVLDGENLVGVITDADIRRTLLKSPKLDTLRAEEVMTANPKVICRREVATKALALFEKFTITTLFVVDKKKSRKVVGYIQLKDLLKAKLL
jgi:arabinose-5-phosphate isomerase